MLWELSAELGRKATIWKGNTDWENCARKILLNLTLHGSKIENVQCEHIHKSFILAVLQQSLHSDLLTTHMIRKTMFVSPT